MNTTVTANSATHKSAVPYFEKTIDCPVCGEQSTHWYLKDGTYLVEEQEDDQFIRKYRWVDPEYNKYHIYFFRFWHCPHCYYTDEYSVFASEQSKFRARNYSILKTIFEEKSEEDPFIRQVAEHLTYPVSTLQDSLCLHLLALYIQLMPAPEKRDPEKLARFYLRIGWMYRIADNQSDGTDWGKRFELTANEYFKIYQRVQSDIVNVLNDVETLNDWISTQIDSDNQPAEYPRWSDYRDQFQTIYNEMMQTIDILIQKNLHYQKIGSDYKQRYLKMQKNPLNASYHDYDSFYDFLERLKSFWPGLPDSEFMALKKSAEAFEEVIKSKFYEIKKIKLFNIYNLLITLLKKIDDKPTTLVYMERLHTQAIALRKAAQRKLEMKKVIDDEQVDEKTLRRFIQKTNDIIKNNNEKRDELKKAIMEEQNEIASEIFYQNRDLTPEQLKEKMEKKGIHSSIISRYVELLGQEKKKGIFQIFKL